VQNRETVENAKNSLHAKYLRATIKAQGTNNKCTQKARKNAKFIGGVK
jgi:hypothetical protein